MVLELILPKTMIRRIRKNEKTAVLLIPKEPPWL